MEPIVAQDFVKRALDVGKIIRNSFSLTTTELERSLLELCDLCDRDGVVVALVQQEFHFVLLKIISLQDVKLKLIIVNIFWKIVHFSKEMKREFLENKTFMSGLITEFCYILEETKNSSGADTTVSFFAETLNESIHSFITPEQASKIYNSTLDAINWNSNDFILHFIRLLNVGIGRCENVNKFLKANIKFLLTKLKTTGPNQSIGVMICKFFSNALDSSDGDSEIFGLFMENKLDQILIWLLFKAKTDITAEYYLAAIKLFHQLLTCDNKDAVMNLLSDSRTTIVTSMIESLSRFKLIAITIYGFEVFLLILKTIENISDLLNEPNQVAWVSLIIDQANGQFDFQYLIELSFKLLTELFSFNTHLISNAEGLWGINLFILDSMIKHVIYLPSCPTERVFIECCNLIAILAANSEKIQNMFLSSNIHSMIEILSNGYLMKIVPHSDDDFNLRIVTMKALRGLVIFNTQAKELLYNEEVHFRKTKLFLINLTDHGSIVHSKAFYDAVSTNLLFLASLVELRSFKYDLLLGKDVNFNFIAHCDFCMSNLNILEAFQELLIVLSGIANETHLITEILPISIWLEFTKRFLNVYQILKNTLIFLQLNASGIIGTDVNSTLLKIALLIHGITFFEDSSLIKAEACVLIQILLKQHREFTKICLDTDLDILLFNIMIHSTDHDLISIAIHAFYVLTESNKVRTKIVKKAAVECNIKLLKCMTSIGTNIANLERDILLSATKQKPDSDSFELVTLLLNNDCKPSVYNVINCIEIKNFKTAGLLLYYCNVYNSDEGHSLRWSQLNLENLDIAWLRRLYQGIPECQIDPYIRWISQRIKQESRNRNKLRDLHDKSHNNTCAGKRYPKTQNRKLENHYNGHSPKCPTKQIPSSIDSMKEVPESHDSPIEDRLIQTMLDPVILVDDVVLANNKPNTKRDDYDYQYKTIEGEISEFYVVFRSGSDYAHHPMDPRCLRMIKHREPLNILEKDLVFMSVRSNPDFYKIKYSQSDLVGATDSCSFDDVHISDLRSESRTEISHIYQFDLSGNAIANIDVLADIHIDARLKSLFLSLHTLKLDSNKITNLPEMFFASLPNLKRLELQNNHLSDFPWMIFRHCSLTELDISRNLLTNFALDTVEKRHLKSLGKVLSLLKLSLSNNKFVEFEVGALSLFQNLEYLDIDGISICLGVLEPIPLKNLKRINMKKNGMEFIQKNFLHEAKEIQSVNFSDNKLTAIFEKAEDVPDESIPLGTSISKPSNIAVCGKFPIPLYEFENLTSLDLSRNNLACGKPNFIPICILKMQKLMKLNMSHNNIEQFPPCSMWISAVIEDLDFSHNNITDMNFYNAKLHFQCLHNLNVSDNQLKRLPPEIGNLSLLHSLDISRNPHLNSLPDEIGLLKNKKLITLIYDGVELNLPKHLKNAKLVELLKYYHNRLKHSIEYYSLKLMVVGYGGRGKTSLLSSLQEIKKPPKSSMTIGINITNWNYPVRHKDKQVDYKFTCWDLAGQEDFYSTHECFITQRALYLVVCDMSKGSIEIERLKPWLLNIRSQAVLAPVIIVCTHLDKIRKENQEDEKQFIKESVKKLNAVTDFPKISNVAFVDARTNNPTIEVLRTKIMNLLRSYSIRNEPLMGEKQPASYLKLEEILQVEAKKVDSAYPILLEKDIKDLVLKNKLDLDEDEIETAIQFLHDCGVIVHFKDLSMRLNNLYFISPQWLCNMMAQIVTTQTLNPYVHNGVMNYNDLKCLFIRQVPLPPSINYEDYSGHCLRILEKFNIAFQKSRNEIMIPSRLPDSPEHRLSPPKETDVIRRIFEFSFLPNGFWPRLITRICCLKTLPKQIMDMPQNEAIIWKHGMFISWEQNLCMWLEGNKEQYENINFGVSKSDSGLRILVQIVDCIEDLIEEWYPGLIDTDIRGTKLMNQFACCTNCDRKFPLDDILQQARTSDHVSCTTCSRRYGKSFEIAIKLIAPDIVFGDLPSNLIVNKDLLKIKFDECIGVGGSGKVYLGYYNGEKCAVKLQNQTEFQTTFSAYRKMRQEVKILQSLQHPSLISMIAVDVEQILLQLAPFGDLNSILIQHTFSNKFLQKISYQIIDGLSFLHENGILYRDLKPQNILVFSLDETESINVKLSDYGISKVLGPIAFYASQGTPGYQAPEVMDKSMSYGFPADIFSFGVVLFNIATKGKHPHDARSHWRSRQGSELISKFNCRQWPRMQECIDSCLELFPDDRSRACDVKAFIKCPGFISIKYVWPLTKQTRVECLVTEYQERRLKIFVANGNFLKQEVRCIDIFKGESKGKPIPIDMKVRILCILIFGDVAILGTNKGHIMLYDFLENNLVPCYLQFPHPILTISKAMLCNDKWLLLVGLLNGNVYYRQDFETTLDLKVEDFDVLNDFNEPITTIFPMNDCIYITSGMKVYKLYLSLINNKLKHTQVIHHDSENSQTFIKCFYPVTEKIDKVFETSFYFSIRNEPFIYNYDDCGNQLKPPTNCQQIIKTKLQNNVTARASRIMCLTVWNGSSGQQYIAVGTGGGYLLIFDQKMNHTSVMQLYEQPITCLQFAQTDHELSTKDCQKQTVKMNIAQSSDILEGSNVSKESEKFTLTKTLIVVGNCYKSIGRRQYDGAVLTLISADISKVSRQFEEHIKLRNE